MTESGGYCRTARRHRASLVASLLLTIGFAAPALARDTRLSVPATTLDAALTLLARETGTEIISTEPGLALVRTRPVDGSMSAARALARLLEGSGFRAVAIRGGGYRIIRASAARSTVRSAAQLRPPPLPEAEIVVTASKQDVPLLRYPGTITVVQRAPPLPASATSDITGLASVTPVLQSTQLGAGRNKVFIRGVADSSFNGSTQSTASVYLDDVQLNYSGPDPGLRLYDLSTVEVLEGPQGTLYGAGAIGGVIRLTSNPVDLVHSEGSISSGVTFTNHGQPGFDIASMANLPISTDVLGLRAVAYRIRDGGYIDDVYRGLSNINRSDTVGTRLSLLLDPGDGWRFEASGVGQQIDTQDSQYTQFNAGPLDRRSVIAQPFTNRVLLGRMVVSKDWDSGLKLFSASGIVGYNSTDQFDASTPPPPGSPWIPVTYVSERHIQTLSQETRLSRTLPGGGSWVAGFVFISDRDILSRSIVSPGTETSIVGVTNVTGAASAFGEATFALQRALFLTLGGRVTAARVDSQPSSTPSADNYIRGRSTRRADPTLALAWQATRRFTLFARFQTGYRTGGLAVARGVGRVADYNPDSIVVGEIGMRRLRDGPTGLAFSATASFAHWKGIQADLVNLHGEPYTVNLGDARIQTIEGVVDWVPLIGLKAIGSFLFTDNVVSGPIADLSVRNNRRLPETPPLAAHGELRYEWRIGSAIPRLGGTVDYVGRSVLGTGDVLDVSQGNYVVLGASTGAKLRKFDISLKVDNLTNRAANRFAFGNPFTLGSRDQETPLRPINARLGVAVIW